MTEQTIRRDLIVVDCETTGLDTAVHVPIEIAAVNVRTGDTFEFAPIITSEQLGAAAPAALAINRYFERRVWEHCPATESCNAEEWSELWKFLSGNTIGGSNIRFDAKMLLAGYRNLDYQCAGAPEPWHYRLADLGSYAAGVLRLPLAEGLPSLHTVCRITGVVNTAPHTALGDALAAAECFRRLAATTDALEVAP